MIDPRAAALDDCLRGLQAGASLQAVLERYPQWADDLRPRLEAAQAAQALGQTLHVPPAAVARGRARFLKRITQAPRPAPARFRPTWLRAGLAAGLVLAFSFSGVILASAQALPGEALYPIKLAVEQTRLHLARDVSHQLALEAEFDRERLEETRAALDRQRSGPVTLVGVLTQTAAGAWQVADIPVTMSPAQETLGQTLSGWQVVATGRLQPSGRLQVEGLSLRTYPLTGSLESFTAEYWIIDQVVVTRTTETILRGTPVLGQPVMVLAARRADGVLFARRLDALGSTSTTSSTPPGVSPAASPSATPMLEPTTTVTPTATPSATNTPTKRVEPDPTRTLPPSETLPPTFPASDTPSPSDTPRPSATSVTRETREPTEQPEETEEPEGTEQPEETEAPEETEQPEPSETP